MSELQPARTSDLAALVNLVGSADGCAAATVWSLPWDIGHYWVIRHGPHIVATGSLQPVGDGARAEIRGLAVDPAFQGEGLATRIVSHLCGLAARAGVEVVCMTRKPGFFERQGFAVSSPDWLPPQRVEVERDRSVVAPRVALRRAQESA